MRKLIVVQVDPSRTRSSARASMGGRSVAITIHVSIGSTFWDVFSVIVGQKRDGLSGGRMKRKRKWMGRLVSPKKVEKRGGKGVIKF